ncbi:MAG TPA: hypothetical protein VF826_19150 [Chloroflexia bacterium]|jgi:hypothetical protein
MKRRSVILIGAVAFAIALLLTLGPIRMALNSVVASSPGDQAAPPQPTNIPTPEAEVLPTYPGAQAKAVAPEHQVPNATVTAFEVYAEASDVIAFYKSGLIKKGWSVRSEVPMRQLSMVWLDESGSLPWGLDIDMPVSHELDEAQNKIVTSWHIFLRRVPMPENVPAYPGATPVDPDPAETEGYPRVIHNAYATNDTLSEIEAYYKRVLPEYGWVRQKPEDANITEGLYYAFRLGSVYDVRTAYLSVRAKPLADGTIHINVLSSGNTNSR